MFRKDVETYRGQSKKQLTVVGWIALSLLAMLLIFAMVTPFIMYDKVDENEYGLLYSTWEKKLVDDTVYEGGRHFTGFMKEFITFPVTQQTIQFFTSEGNSVNSRTLDGLEIFLDVSFQYQLQKDSIFNLYKQFGTNYEATFWRVARDVIRDTASSYDAIQFFTNRTLIGQVIEDNMVAELEGTYATLVPAFQMLDISLPASFEDALERLEVAKREIEIATEQQAEALIRAETLIIEAEAEAQITILEAEAGAEAFLIMIEAQAEAVDITLTQQTESYYALAQALNLTSAELLSYLWIQALTEVGENGNLIIIGENTPELLITEP